MNFLGDDLMKKGEIKNKVGLGGLTALVVGGTIGSGIFALPATMTEGANPAGILLGWAIVALGMLALASVYRNLTLQQPEIDDGIYGWSKKMPLTAMELEMQLEMQAI